MKVRSRSRKASITRKRRFTQLPGGDSFECAARVRGASEELQSIDFQKRRFAQLPGGDSFERIANVRGAIEESRSNWFQRNCFTQLPGGNSLYKDHTHKTES